MSFWFDDPNVLTNEMARFYLVPGMSKNEKLNAITRFVIYASVLAVLYFNNVKYLFPIIIVLLVTYFIHKNTSEAFSGSCNHKFAGSGVNSEGCYGVDSETVRPTINNPFMNPSVFDNPVTFRATKYAENTPESNEIKKDIYNKFSYNLYKDVSDIYDTNNGFRQFYTVPDNLNCYDDFKQFLYGDTKFSSKENTYDGFKNLYDPLKNKK